MQTGVMMTDSTSDLVEGRDLYPVEPVVIVVEKYRGLGCLLDRRVGQFHERHKFSGRIASKFLHFVAQLRGMLPNISHSQILQDARPL